MNEDLFKAIAGIIIFLVIVGLIIGLIFSCNRLMIEVKKVGLKNILEEYWEGREE